jgi:hypothetical protein
LPGLRHVFPGIPLVESPLFHAIVDELDLTAEEYRVACNMHERGYAVIDFPDDELDARIDWIKTFLGDYFDCDMADPETPKNSDAPQRVQDVWVYNEDVRAIASNPEILNLLSKLYGRQAFPFQTLNFPVGTQQHLHSDSIHFSSIPERFMCAVWLAMEDVRADAGPLTYLPGSHKWPILNNVMIGRRGFSSDRQSAQGPFEAAWDALVETSGIQEELFFARKGQALIWAANLLHGGSSQRDPKLTRWSQVTHYYFEDCIYYTPAFSDDAVGLLDARSIVDVATGLPQPNFYLGDPIESEAAAHQTPSLLQRVKRRMRKPARLPHDFDPDTYHRFNPDVAAARLDAAKHYVDHGKAEGRRYRYR